MAQNTRALVPYTVAYEADGDHDASSYTAADAVNLKRGYVSPQELIMHESIRNLLAEVAELRERCNGLETSNAELSLSMHKLEQAYRNELVRAPLTQSNLTGYAQSDATSASTPSDTSDAASRKPFVRQSLAAVAEILDSYNERLNAQTAHQQKLEKTLIELTDYKRSSEALFSALKDELNGLNLAEADHSSDYFCGPQKRVDNEIATDFLDKHERLEGRFNIFELKAEETKADVGEIKDRLDTIAQAIEADVPVSNGGTNSVKHIETKLELLQDRQQTFTAFRKEMLRKYKHEQTIDDAPTKDALYSLFKSIEKILISDGQRRRSGPFEGDFDELMQLRDRIIYRLSLFDAYGAAFHEAKRAAKNVD
ncbi:hypothetical protein LTR36_001153 [Oleoguttula mirabilis]|uniref:Uncharacterized protein n=1 Tax=Oleoguttula mirabilis TaxID=1507867 RepID=A0AAV9JPV4_9PEZI|nr:hypothetical protein LTR36_001153 [Oleoguttula mirabilis]